MREKQNHSATAKTVRTTHSTQTTRAARIARIALTTRTTLSALTMTLIVSCGGSSVSSPAPAAGDGNNSGATQDPMTRGTTTDLLISQFQAGRADTTPAPMTIWRPTTAVAGNSMQASGCRTPGGELGMAGGSPACRSYAIEILNNTGSAVDLSNYALISANISSGGTATAWGAADATCGPDTAATPPQQSAMQLIFSQMGMTNVTSALHDLSRAYCSRRQLSGMLANAGIHLVSRVWYNGFNFTPDTLWTSFTYSGDDGVGLARSLSSFTGSPSSCPANTIAVSFTPSGGSAESWCIIDVYGADTTTASYTDPGVSWEAAGNNANDGRGFTWLRRTTVTTPSADWNASRGCTSECETANGVTSASTSQWTFINSYDYSNIGRDTVVSGSSSSALPSN